MPQITDQQLQALRDKIDKLTTDKKAADTATTIADTAYANLQHAQIDATAADGSLVTANGQVTADVNDLRAFVDALAPTPPPPPEPPTPPVEGRRTR